MIQVEALEDIKSDGWNILQGDRVTVSDDAGARWCAAGWAKSVNGEIPTGERRVVRSVIQPHGASHPQKASEVTSNG